MHIIVIIIASVVDALLINYSNLNDWSDDWVAQKQRAANLITQ
jgi:hypothetical protein